MTRRDYEAGLLALYAPVKLLSEKSGDKVLLLRHRKLGRDLVLRSYEEVPAAYRALKSTAVPSLPRVYDVIDCDDGGVVLEEYVPGERLSDLLTQAHFTYRAAKSILRDLCAGLSALHRAGFVHRDVKPDNVVIQKDGRAVLVDLGAGRAAAPTPDTRRLGTTGYAAPEQYVGASDARSDVYALGILLNVMLTGRHPSEVLPDKARAARIVRRATATHPDERFPDVAAFAAAL